MYRMTGIMTMLLALLATTWSLEAQERLAQVESEIEFEENITLLERPAALEVENVPLQVALTQLGYAAGVGLAFSPSFLPEDELVSCDCGEESLGGALDRLLDGTGLRYNVIGKQIVVEKIKRELKLPEPSRLHYAPDGLVAFASATERVAAPASSSALTEGAVQGMVRDAATGQPLGAVQISLPGLNLGTLSSADGSFDLTGIPAGSHRIRAELIGYRALEETVEVAPSETVEVDFALTQEALGLDEIVVTGTAGQARRREVGNTIAQLNPADLEPVSSMDDMLRGRAAGVSVSDGAGRVGSGQQIRLRGTGSISMSNEPLIFVDGVRVRSEGYPRGVASSSSGARSPNVTPNPLNDINPADIERIEIIKGPAATTLYGTEASAGVIQIFTRRGAEGATTWNLQTDQSMSWLKPWVAENDRVDRYFGLQPFLRNAHGQRYSLSASGGSSGLRYFVSGSLVDQQGVLPNDQEDRYGFRGRISAEPLDGLQLEWQAAYSMMDLQHTPAGNNTKGLTTNAMRAPFNSMNSSDPDVIGQVLDWDMNTRTDRFTTGLSLTHQTRENLVNRLTLGLDHANRRMHLVRPFGFVTDPEGIILDTRWTNELLTLDYVGTLNFGVTSDMTSSFSWGLQGQEVTEHEVEADGRGFPGPGNHTVTSAAQQLTVGNEQRVITGGGFIQNVFGWQERLYVTLGLRVDGNSAFGEDLGLQPYPKASASYIISDYEFWPEHWGEMKLRGAYGAAGRAPGAFDAVRTWSGGSFRGQSSFVPANVGNPELGPEISRELEVGFDLSTLEDRLGAEFTFYRQVTDDALFAVNRTASLGFLSSQLANVGQISNRGVELALNALLLERPSFAWNTGLHLSTNQSRVDDLGGAPAFSVGGYGFIEEGQPVMAIRATRVANPDEFAEPILEEDHFFGPNHPTHTIGLNTSVDVFDRFTISAQGEYLGGHYMYDQGSANAVDRGGGAPDCQAAYDHVGWDDFSPDADFSQINARDRAMCYREIGDRSLWIYAVDHFELRHVTLQVPIDRFVPRAASASFSVSARNALRWFNDDIRGGHPQMTHRDDMGRRVREMGEDVPPASTISASVRVVF